LHFNSAFDDAGALLDGLPVACCLFDTTGALTDCNADWARLLGFESKEDAISCFLAILPPYQPCGELSQSFLRKNISEAVQHGSACFEFLCVGLSGRFIFLDLNIRTVRPGCFAGCATDISHYKRAKENSDTKELAEIFMAASPMFVELWNDDLTFIDCSQQTLDMFEVSSKEEYLRRYYEFVPEYQPCGARSQDKTVALVEKALQDGRVQVEWMHLQPNGEPLPVELTLVRLWRNGKHIVICYNIDLRPVKKAIEEVRQADERARLMLDATPLSCFMTRQITAEDGSPSFEIVDCNQAAVDLFGFASKAEAIACFKYTIPRPKDGTSREASVISYVNVAREQGSNQFEFTHVHPKDGQSIPCEVTVVHVNYKGESLLACFQDDLRAIKAMVEKMKRIEIAEEESRAKTRFLTRMSHEIRTPLNAIKGVAEIQMQKSTHLGETEEAFSRIHMSASLLHTIINDILDLSKIEAGKMEIAPKTYDLASMIADTVQLNIMNIGNKNIQFKLRIDEHMPCQLIGDELRIKQILNNFLSNAFKYTNEGTVSLHIDLVPNPDNSVCSTGKPADKDEVFVSFRITDTGQGMTQEQVNSLFDIEFTRFNLQRNYAIEGSGLGMNISSQLVKMMNGTISGVSAPNQGSLFTVCIPQARGNNEILGRDLANSLQNLDVLQKSLAKVSKLYREPMPYGRVLVVDDIESNLFVAKGLLMPYKLVVDTAESGHEAIEKVNSGEVYDIIFMDHMMPGIDGIQTTKIIRESGYNHPIVALTANVVSSQADRFMNNGFSGFVSKPIDVSILDEHLIRFIRDRHSQQERAAAIGTYIATPDATESDPLPQQLVEYFLRDAKKSIELLQSLFQSISASTSNGNTPTSETLKSYASQVHGMKSALNNVHRVGLARVARNLEYAANNINIEGVLAQTPSFLKDLQETISSLESQLLSGDNSADKDEDPEFIQAQILSICKACEILNKKQARIALEALDKHPCSKRTKAILSEISLLLLQSDFEEAAELAQQVIK